MEGNHKPEKIIGKLREAEIILAQGGPVADACRRIGVTEQSYYRWRKECVGLKMTRGLSGISCVGEIVGRKEDPSGKTESAGDPGRFTGPATGWW